MYELMSCFLMVFSGCIPRNSLVPGAVVPFTLVFEAISLFFLRAPWYKGWSPDKAGCS